MIAHPYVKAAGGKWDMFSQIGPLLPRDYEGYGEPFVGGGGTFFALLPDNATLSDSNARLIDTYLAVRDDVDGVIRDLRTLKYPDDYYAIRADFNNDRTSDRAKRAAWFIYLSKTCYNGLFRVNKKGGFNVPVGKYVNPTICDEANLRACSDVLQGRTILSGDFEVVAERAKPRSLWYFDSPYVPIKTDSFVGYSKDGFTEADHRRLAALFRRLTEEGVLCVASNSDTPLVRELYDGFDMTVVYRGNRISSKAGTRDKKVPELLIRSGRW